MAPCEDTLRHVWLQFDLVREGGLQLHRELHLRREDPGSRLGRRRQRRNGHRPAPIHHPEDLLPEGLEKWFEALTSSKWSILRNCYQILL